MQTIGITVQQSTVLSPDLLSLTHFTFQPFSMFAINREASCSERQYGDIVEGLCMNITSLYEVEAPGFYWMVCDR